MFFRNEAPLSARFRHLSRSLQPGEGIPPLPSLFEQLSACALDVTRQKECEPHEEELLAVDLEDDDE
ncbi:MAG: hypothetical protein RKL24_03645 [Defluviicoccus sp.]|nr:hypothetical protein [Defluviicoccus sp.]